MNKLIIGFLAGVTVLQMSQTAPVGKSTRQLEGHSGIFDGKLSHAQKKIQKMAIL